jgi:murein L,D-transpeptidase YcbB/YkuD
VGGGGARDAPRAAHRAPPGPGLGELTTIRQAPTVARILAACLLAGLSGLGVPGSGAASAQAGPAASDLRAAIESADALRVDGQPLRVGVLRELYAAIGFEPVWGADPAGAARAALALEALLGARDHGLVPAHYGLTSLRRRAEPATPAAAIERELLLTDALLRLAVDLGAGRLRPASVQPDWGIPPPAREEPVRELADAIEAGTLAAWIESLPPPHAGYARLVAALRALHAAADRAARPRSGPDPRARQIAVNLERWRWLPRSLESRHVVVNAADATLVVVEDGAARLASKVVVGDELHPTPVVRSEIGAIVFNPPWTVPTSIVVEEFLPKLRANPRFLLDNDITILDRPQDPYGLAIDWTAVSAQRFPFRLQQRPGGWNPLGRLRFATPNRFDVYLHDTPLPELFLRGDRALSHGCVRVERARELAALVLAGQAAGRSDALDRAMASRATSVVIVSRPLPVYFLYWTAFVDDGGRLQLRDDPYDRDARVAAALSRATPARARTAGPARAAAPGQDPGSARRP